MKLMQYIALFGLMALLVSASSPKPERPTGSWIQLDPTTLLPLKNHPNTIKDAIYADPNRDPAERANELLRRMTFDEKLNLTGGWNRFMFNGVERLGIRDVSMADGGQGVRLQTALIKTKSTTMPSMITIASTWNRELSSAFGRAVAQQCRVLGVDILLGPGINMQRLGVGGRNFEYFGEDPILAREMVVPYIKAMQNEGVIAVPKHFIGNDQDFCRHITSSNIDERTLREIYLPAWEGAFVEAGALGMMTGNNLVNGTHSCMNRVLINDILRSEYGFMGMAMTDWQNSSYFPSRQAEVLTSGHSLLMPDNNAFRDFIEPEVEKSAQRRAEVESMVEKMAFYSLYSLFKMGVYDRPVWDDKYYDTYTSHIDICREVAVEGIIMLKNDKNTLPLAKGGKVLLMGKEEKHSGGGSGFVEGYDHKSYCTTLPKYLGGGFVCNFSADDKQVMEADVVLFNIVKETAEGSDVPFDEPKEQLARLREVIKLNKNVVVLINAANTLPTDWAKDVKAILWCSYLGQERGEAMGAILAGEQSPSGKLPFTIEKEFNQSPAPEFNYIGGKPYWRGNNEYRAYWLGYVDKTKDDFSKYVKPHQVINVPYSEGIFMGYRWYDKQKIEVAFPFGYGLSYSEFQYANLKIENKYKCSNKIIVTFDIRNVGKRDAKEVAQVYVRDVLASVERPKKELKGFQKVSLKAGESVSVSVELDSKAFAYWCVKGHTWCVEEGEFIILVGGSSDNLPLKESVNI